MNPTIAAITSQTISYTPAVIAGVQAAEASGAPGESKLQAVVNGVLATSGALETVPNPNVAGVAALVNLVVNILNSLGIFKHRSAPATN